MASGVEGWFLRMAMVVCVMSQVLAAQPGSSISFMPLPEGATACASGPAGVVGGVACYVSPLTTNAEIWTINEAFSPLRGQGSVSRENSNRRRCS